MNTGKFRFSKPKEAHNARLYDPDGDGVSVAYINGDDIPDAYHWGDRYLFNFNPDVDDYFESTGWDMWGEGSQLQVITPWGPPRIENMF